MREGVARSEEGTGNRAGTGSFAADTRAPTVAVSSAATFPATRAFDVTLSFSEPVTGLALDEVEVAPGNKTNLRGSERDYTVTVNPPGGFEGSVTVRVPGGVAQDAGDHDNLAGAESFIVDTRAPSLLSVTVSGNRVTLLYDQDPDPAAVPLAGAFDVQSSSHGVDSVTVPLTATNPVSIARDTVRLSLAEAVRVGATVVVSYDVGSVPLRDRAGNHAASFDGERANNVTPRAALKLAVTPNRVAEGASATTVTVTATYPDSATFSEATKVAIAIADGTATRGTDFAGVADFEIEILAGQSSRTGTFTLTPVDDALDEGDGETVVVAGAVAGFRVTPATIVIVDDDDPAVTVEDEVLTGTPIGSGTDAENARAFDRNIGTYFRAGLLNASVGLDLGSGVRAIARRVRFYPGPGATLAGTEFQGSNDGSSWTRLGVNPQFPGTWLE